MSHYTIIEWLNKKLPNGDEPIEEAQLLLFAEEVDNIFRYTSSQLINFITRYINKLSNNQLKILLFCLIKYSESLDDLFGERVGGWARELKDVEITDFLAALVGKWVSEDISRSGYLEAWVAIGENNFKKRLGLMGTLFLNKDSRENINKTFRVVGQLTNSDDPCIIDAAVLALSAVKNISEREQFFSRWEPRCEEQLFKNVSNAVKFNGDNK